MTQAISTATSQSKITLTQLMNFKTPEDKTVFEAKEKWLEQLNQIPDNQRATYRAGIDRVLQELDTRCTILRSEGYKSHEIVAELSKTISMYNTSYALFAQNTITYNQHILAEEQKHASLKEQFGSAGRSFKVYHLPEHTPTDPYEAQAQFEALVVLGAVHTVGTALQLTGATVAEGAKRACKLTKTTETACRATLDFGKKIVDAIPIDIKAAIQDVQARGGAALAEVLEEHYKFPKEQAKQLAYQNMDDLLIVSTVAAGGIASRLAMKAGKHFANKRAPLSEGATATTATASEGASSTTATAAVTQETINACFKTSANLATEGATTSAEMFANLYFKSSTNYVLNKWPVLETQLPNILGTQSSAAQVRSVLAAEAAQDLLGTQSSAAQVRSVLAAEAAQDLLGTQSSAVQVRSVLANEAAQERFLLNLRRSNATRTTFERLKKHIESHREGHSTMDAVIDHEMDMLNLLVPGLSSTGKKIIDHFSFREVGSGNFTTVLIDAGNRFVRKEFQDFGEGVSEFAGLNFMKSLNLKRTAVAEPLAFWESDGQAFLVKSFMHGEPIKECIDAVGKLPLGSKERTLGVERLEKMAFSTGGSTAELQMKGAHLPPAADAQLSSFTKGVIRQMEECVSDTGNLLSLFGKEFKTEPDHFLESVYRKFEHNPGPVSYGFGFIDSSELLWNPAAAKSPPLAYLNTRAFSWVLDNKGAPCQFISEEYALLSKLFVYEGVDSGLEFSEIIKILKSYDMGYKAAYTGPAHSLAAIQLYDLYATLETISWSFTRLRGSSKNPRLLRLIDSELESFDQKLHTYSQSEATILLQNPSTLLGGLS